VSSRRLRDYLEGLVVFNPPESPVLPEDVTAPYICKIKGRTFYADAATFVSRYGGGNYEDHPLQWLKFTLDGKRLHSCCLGPDGSNASVAGPFHLKEIDSQGNYVIELLYTCRTTFILKSSKVDELE